jgi:hypothetical protein
MDHADFPWRPLGTLLVGNGLLTASELERALVEQRRTGRLLGQILVGAGYLTALSLARALAEQHGVELQPAMSSALTSGPAPPLPPEAPPRQVPSPEPQGRAWRPLGKLLVAKGFLTGTELDQALAEQEQHPQRRLGAILVARGYLSGSALALALAEQHGVELETEDEFKLDLQAVVRSAAPGEPSYRVFEVAYEPSYQPGSILYESANFLEAADFACEFVERQNPEALEIQRTHGAARETVWMYSESRAAAAATSRKSLVETFGFDPMRWDAGARFDSESKSQ